MARLALRKNAERSPEPTKDSGNCAKIAPKKRHFGHSGISDRFYNQQLTETKGANPGSTPAASTILNLTAPITLIIHPQLVHSQFSRLILRWARVTVSKTTRS
jgi:hypothetical protein